MVGYDEYPRYLLEMTNGQFSYYNIILLSLRDWKQNRLNGWSNQFFFIEMPTSLLKWFDMLPTAGILFILVMALSGSDRRPLVSSFSLSLSTGRTSTMLSATQKVTMPQMEPPFADIAGRKKKPKLPIFDKRIPAPVDQYMQAMREKEAARHEPHYLETVEVRKHPRLLNGIRMRRLPRSDLVVSEIGLGTLTFGEQVLTDKAHSMLDYAVKDFGLNLIVRLSPLSLIPFTDSLIT